MKKIAAKIMIWSLIGFCPLQGTFAQSQEIAQLTLNIQKLNQLRKILQQLKDGYDILTKGYNTIKDIAEGNYSVHKNHLDGLLNVSPAVRNYKRTALIIQYQYALVSEYRKAYNRFASSGQFRPQELVYISGVYNNLLDQSLNNLDELTTILTGGKTRMSDDERLQTIDRIYFDMEEKLNFLREFNNTTSVLALERKKEKRDIESVGKLHGIKN